MAFTLVFDGDLRRIPANPFKIDSPFGKVVSASVGDGLERAERLRLELEKIAYMDEFLDAAGAREMMNIAREAVNADRA